MLKIGDFSKLSQVTVKALRYYDEVGLLKPAQVDHFSSYRYYDVGQLPRLNRILAFKDLGFSLEQIAQLLDENLPAAQIRGMLRMRQAEIQQRMQDDQNKLNQVEARLRLIELEDTMPEYECIIKKIEPVLVAAVRGITPSYPEQGGLWNTLMGYLGSQKAAYAGPCLTIYHDPEYKEHDTDLEVCQPLAAPVQGSSRVNVYELPAAIMAVTVHHGPFVTIGKAHEALHRWIQENGYQISGPNREIYLRTPGNGSQTWPDTLTEIQYPVRKN